MNNYFLLSIAIFSLFLIYKILWIKNFHNVFFFGLCYQWLAVNVKVFYALILNLNFENLHQYSENIIQAWAYSNICILVLALGIRISIRKKKYDSPQRIFNVNLKSFSNYYIGLSILTLTILNPKIYPSSIQQILFQIIYLKYVLFFIGFVNILQKRDFKNRLMYYFVFEFILSFSGYFSSFKDFFFLLFLAYLYSNSKKISGASVFVIAFLVIIAINFGIVWSAVKEDYRFFQTKGEKTQNVSRSTGESLAYLSDKFSSFNSAQYQDGLEKLIDRIEYIDYFSASIGYIPSHKDHENGNLLLDAFLFGFQPRFLFPDKKILDDSKFTTEYTGIQVAGFDEGTSICLGYAANSYIDFGDFFFMSPLVWGIFIGYLYNKLYKTVKSDLWGLSITFPLFFMVINFENEFYKLIPPLIYYFIVAYLFLKYGAKYLIINSIENKRINV